jgi:imidazolonepropionase-like amidohydrolase
VFGAVALRIEADVLIPGRGAPVADGAVVLDGPTIAYAGPRAEAPPADEVVRVPVVMPGMWDCHTHLIGIRHVDMALALHEHAALCGARAAVDAARVLQAGFTSIREVGGFGINLATAVADGSIAGPTIYAAGAFLSQTGGHGDVHRVPLAWVHESSARLGKRQLCDGVPECVRAVRLQLRAGAKVIKVCASGGVLSELDDPIHQQFSDEELRAIVEEAGRAERIVAAHCHGKPGIMAALRAGVQTIEHGSYLDAEAAAAMRDAGAILVPTRFIVDRMLALTDKVPPFAAAKIVAVAERHLEAMAIAHETGVTIALGTDIGTSGPDTLVPWGMNAHELTHLVAAGLTPLEAIEAATATGPLTLGPQGPRSGLLAEGYDADVLAVAANPVDDIAVLTAPANITHVWKAGVAVKEPLPS